MEKNKISNFLTPDISYLLGMITGRGEIQQNPDVKKIIIDFEYKSLESSGLTTKWNQKLHIQTSLDKIMVRLQNMGIHVVKNVSDKNISLVLKWVSEDISWIFIKFLINGTHHSYHDFEIPTAIFETNNENKREFLRGLGDTTAYVRESNNVRFSSDDPKRHRVYIEITQKNWLLPAQICQLLQTVAVPVQNINYGHPNLRDSKNKKGNRFWAKEHQMKIYADDFQQIGFYISHKEEALTELADHNKKEFSIKQALCDGSIKRSSTKPPHPDESDNGLPADIKGKHFDSFKEICNCLNCYMQK